MAGKLRQCRQQSALMRLVCLSCVCIGMLTFTAGRAHAGGGPFGIDHQVSLNKSGVWKPTYQDALEVGVVALGVGGALWFGNDDSLGHVFWQSVDSMALSSVAAYGSKYIFRRARPVDAPNDPNKWFSSGGNHSFPSGSVTIVSSFVTPFVVNYGRSDPWVWGLEALPAYMSVARVKNHEHWQSDVLVGWLLGSAIGYYSTTRDVPLTVEIVPHGFVVGFSKIF